MDTTTLAQLLEEDGVTCKPDGLIVKIHSSWVVIGEDRLSYTTLVRLIECCREHHWSLDILSTHDLGKLTLDSITRSIAGEFISPIPIGSLISITYKITEVREKGYALHFEVRDVTDQTVRAWFDIVSIFYDPTTNEPITPPPAILQNLKSMCNRSSPRSETVQIE